MDLLAGLSPSEFGDLTLIALIAALAQTVNQSMGMGYGVITSSLLLTTGMSPTVVSATVVSATIHASQVATGPAGALGHWRLGQVDPRVALGLAVPGAAAGFLGALLLASFPGEVARPAVGVILLALGGLVLLRFARPGSAAVATRWDARSLTPLGAAGGFLDATGGGGWGPVTMGTLMARPPAEPRRVVGTVNTGEAFVTVGVTAGFLAAQGLGAFHLPEALALMAGGVAVSIPAAALARRMRPRTLGLAVGLLLVALNTRTVASALGLDDIGAGIVALGAAGGSVAVLAVVQRRGAQRASRVASSRRGVSPLPARRPGRRGSVERAH